MGDLGNRLKNASDWLVKHIPGFAGYIKREERRRADKIFRDFLVSKLHTAKDNLSKATVTLTDSTDFSGLKKVTRIEAKFETATDKLRLADYGYTGWFDTVSIDFDELDKIYKFDVELTSSVEEIISICEKIESMEAEEIVKNLAIVSKSIDDLDMKLKERDNLFIKEINFEKVD